MTENKEQKSLRASFQTLHFRGGVYAVALCMIAIVLVIAINLVASKLNINIDMTATGLYTLDEDTIAYVSGIEDEIVLYYFAQTGMDYQEIDNVIDRFDGLGKNMRVEKIDPILHPNYARGLVGEEKAATLQFNSIIVSNLTNGKNKLVLTSEMIIESVDYSTYQTTYTSDVEGQIASAILYVTTDKLPVLYVMDGQGQAGLSEVQSSLLSKNNVDVKTFDSVTMGEIPEDCDILFINYPMYDMTKEQTEVVKKYLENGGNVIVTVDYYAQVAPNLQELLAYYGVEVVPGIVYETDSRYYSPDLPYCLIPQMETHAITEGILGQKRLFLPETTGLRIMENKRGTISATNLFYSTDGAYSKVDLYSMGENKADGDIDGPFSAGILVEEMYHGNVARLLVYSSYLWVDMILEQKSYGNRELFLNSVNYLAGTQSSFYAPTKNLSQQVPSWNLTEAQTKLHLAIKVILLPLLCLVSGAVIVFRRRRAR